MKTPTTEETAAYIAAFTLAVPALAFAASAPLGFSDAISGGETVVAWVNHLPVATLANTELRFGNIFYRDSHLATTPHIGDGALGDNVCHRAL